MKYKNYNDYELIYMVRENDNFCYDELFNKYQPVIKSIAYDFYTKYKNYGYDLDDFNQEANLAFHKSVNGFDESKNILFYTFCTLCIRRTLMSFCRRISNNKKNISVTNLLSIDEYDMFGFSNVDDYNRYSINAEIVKKTMLDLNFEDSCIFELVYNGFSYYEISLLLDLSVRHIQFKSRKNKEKFSKNMNIVM